MHKMIKRSLLICLILVGIQMSSLFMSDVPKEANMGYVTYFTIQNSSRELLYTIVLILLLPSFSLLDEFESVKNHHHYMTITRIGYKEYLKRTLLTTFMTAFLSRLLTELAAVNCIHFFYSRFDFQELLGYMVLVNDSPLVNTAVYIVLASLGTGVFSCFWFSLIQFINNKYIYRGIMILWQFIAMIGASFLVSLFNTHTEKAFAVLTAFVPTSLMTPGQIYESQCILNFSCALFVYGFLTMILLFVTYKERLKHA